MSEVEHWKEMMVITSSRIKELESDFTNNRISSKWSWFVGNTLKSNRTWYGLAEIFLKEAMINQDRRSKFKLLQSVTRRGNDDE